jgi:TRAP-type C4-dicarboxylate transport system permease small subunit
MPESSTIFHLLPPGPPFLAALAGLYALGLLGRAFFLRRWGPERWDRLVAFLEGSLLSGFLLLMIVLAAFQIFLRNVFHSGYVWVDPLLRYLVLWVGMTGAFVATRGLRHINIDVLGRALPEPARPWARALTSLVSLATCALLANASWAYLEGETLFGSRPFLGIPSWAAASILVAAFAGMGWRFLGWTLWPRAGGPGRPVLLAPTDAPPEGAASPGGGTGPGSLPAALGPRGGEGGPRGLEDPS